MNEKIIEQTAIDFQKWLIELCEVRDQESANVNEAERIISE